MAFKKKPATPEELSSKLFLTVKNAAFLVDRSPPFLYKVISNGRLRMAEGLIERVHLIEQARAGFPQLDEDR